MADTLEKLTERARQRREKVGCPNHACGKLPKGRGLWEVSHAGCDYPTGPCDCYCGENCRREWSDEAVAAFAINMLEQARPYLGHLLTCKRLQNPYGTNNRCDCGFDELIRQLAGKG